MIRTAILGASGFVGGELLRLCAGHPELRPVNLFGDSKAGQGVASVHPHLTGAFGGLHVEQFRKARSTASTCCSPRCRTAIRSGWRATSSSVAFRSSISAPISG